MVSTAAWAVNRAKAMVVDGLTALPWLLLPPRCLLCGSTRTPPGLDLCRSCLRDLPRLGPACPSCARPVPDGRRCGPCRRDPPPWDRARCAFRYDAGIAELVQRLKYHGDLAAGVLLGRLLARSLRALDCELLVPVPLAPARLLQRGYDQATELALAMSGRSGTSLASIALRRVRDTPPQTGLDAASRRRNLRGAFRGTAALAGRRVAVLDDVLTTGATLAAATRAARRAGARGVEVWAVARTVPDGLG